MMSNSNNITSIGEGLREAVAEGNELRVKEILQRDPNTINSQNSVNGWTALHWACKRGHYSVVQLLLQNGADASIKNNEGYLAYQLTRLNEIRGLFEVCQTDGECADEKHHDVKLPFIPNYLSNPSFPFGRRSDQSTTASQYSAQSNSLIPDLNSRQPAASSCQINTTQLFPPISDREIVLKIRQADVQDQDFYEIDLPQGKALTFDLLLGTMCQELGVERENVKKLRKLPNTIIRRDRDVTRLKDFQELELVMK